MGNYYNRNTRRFLHIGHGGSQLAIRRAVWGPGVHDREQAIQYVNQLVRREIASVAGDSPHILDLGCGVGGSLIYLASPAQSRLGDAPLSDARFTGVTISGVQADLGRRFVRERGLERIRIEEADFTAPSFWSSHPPAGIDVAFAIESFIHVPHMLSHLETIANRIRPGGLLLVVDDMISRAGARRYPDRRARRWLREFETGWYAHGLSGVEQVAAAAEQAGLELLEARNLTPYLELDRPRDMVARAFMSVLRWWPLRSAWFNNLLGGNALQLALKSGLLGYYYLVFRVPGPRRSV